MNHKTEVTVTPSFMTYFTAVRPWSFTASVIPVILGTVLASNNDGAIDVVLFLLTIICVISVHCAGNLTNTYYDYKNGIDKSTSDDQTLVRKLLKSEDIFRMSIMAYVLGCVSFIVLFLRCKASYGVLMTLFLTGVSGAFFYTGSLSLKYNACGDISIVLLFGPLCVLSAYVVQANILSWQPVLYSIPFVLHTEAILHANNSRDREDDKMAAIKTFAIIIGKKNCYIFYMVLLLVPYCCVFILSFTDSKYFLLPFLSIMMAGGLENKFRLEEWKSLPQETAKLNLLFGFLYITAFLLK